MKEGRAAIEREVDEVVRQVKDAQELELGKVALLNDARKEISSQE